MDVIANNVANESTTRTPQGGPYRREDVVFTPANVESNLANGLPGAGVQVATVLQDQTPPRMVYEPGNPDANGQGYVAYPNIDPITETTQMMAAQRAYQANITAADAEIAMAQQSITLGRF
jgi:flagellar basal-body rod protein FlgC